MDPGRNRGHAVVKLYVEGDGDTAALKAACREGFTTFITKAGIENRPRVVACGSRRDAYESFCTAIANGDNAVMLVDSEAPVAAQHRRGESATWRPWGHLNERVGDGWDTPAQSRDSDCHLMVQCMESWFVADRIALSAFFGQGFNKKHLPANPTLEAVDKTKIYAALAKCTKDCKSKGQYGKGAHSFKLLACIDPNAVSSASPWAKRFLDELGKKTAPAKR